MRAGKPRRAGPYDGDALAGFGGALEILLAVPHGVVGGVTLQQADLDRLALGRLANACLLAQCFGRADPGAHAAENVLFKDGTRGSVDIAVEICRMNFGMSIAVGQAVTQGAS